MLVRTKGFKKKIHTNTAKLLHFTLLGIGRASQLPVNEEDVLLFLIHDEVTGMDIAVQKTSLVMNRPKDTDQLTAIDEACVERHAAIVKHFRGKRDASRRSYKTRAVHVTLDIYEPWDLHIYVLRVNKMEKASATHTANPGR